MAKRKTLPGGVELCTVTSPEGDRLVFTTGGRCVGHIYAGCDITFEEMVRCIAELEALDPDTMESD